MARISSLSVVFMWSMGLGFGCSEGGSLLVDTDSDVNGSTQGDTQGTVNENTDTSSGTTASQGTGGDSGQEDSESDPDSERHNPGIAHTYNPDYSSIFPNPERGWHHRRDLDGRGDDDTRNFSKVKEAGDTIVHSYLRLDDFENEDELSRSYLDNLQDALNAVRDNGLKVVFRPSYVWDESPSVPESRILGHVAQLGEVLSANADVLMHLEAGYLGKWGEWHSGEHTDLSERSKAATRYRLVKQILDTTPENIPVAIRYPMALKEILDYEELLGSPPSGSGSLTQMDRDRLGHHNDCFLYNDSDRGTYSRNGLWFGDYSLQEQKRWLFDLMASYGGNKIMGGETCDGMERFDDTQIDMAAANWTEINTGFWGNFVQAWKDQDLPAQGSDPAETTYDRLSRKLGYRLRLIDATFPTTASAGGGFGFSANLSNDGYAGVIKTRPVYLVFESGSKRYNVELTNVDVRTWLSGPIVLDEKTVTLPSSMPPGTYTLGLWLPDAFENLQSRPEYAIRFANDSIWDPKNGYNVLSDSVTIE